MKMNRLLLKNIHNIIIDEQDSQNSDGSVQASHSSLFVVLSSSRSDIFKNDKNLAWEIMDTESRLYTESEVTLDNITYLASLYMVCFDQRQRLIETLNGLQDNREGYFSNKMQKLMREPFITRAFNHQVDNRKDVLENRRKEIEQRI